MTQSVMIVSTGIVPAPPILGGAIESHTFALANALGREGATVHYVSDVRADAALQANVISHPVHAPIKKFPVPFPGWILTHAIGGVLSARVSYGLAKKRTVDVAHFHDETSALLFMEMRPKVPVVFTLHNPPPWVGSVTSRAEALTRSMISTVAANKVVKRADHFIALSQAIADGFVRLLDLDERDVSVVPHPVDTEFFKPDTAREFEAREKFGIKGSYVLFVGRLDPRKGVSSLLQAIARLDPRVLAIIVGDGIEKQSLLEQTRTLGIESSVRFLGAVPSDMLPGLYSGADCLVFPSVSEMSPLTVVEALAGGLPVVAFDLPVIRDVIRPGFNGFILDHDVDALASTIALITTDPQLRKTLKKNARAMVAENNSPQAVARRLLRIYEDVSCN